MSPIKPLLSFLILLVLALGAASGVVAQPAFQSTPGTGLYLPVLLNGVQPSPTRGATHTPVAATQTPGPGVTMTPVPPTATTQPPTHTPTPTPTETSITFAVIGDYGNGSPEEASVAALVDSWNVDFIITVGDNNYPDGKAETIDANIGQFYHEYIYPYQGSYGPGASENRFFPTLGNHDYYSDSTQNNPQPYLDYFTLPGNERYYQFSWENVDFFALDSYYMKPNDVSPGSTQYNWLQQQLDQSNGDWQVVYFHDAIFSSSLANSDLAMDWPFKDWGADLVLTAHVHNYERLTYNGLTYVVNGLGGDELDPFPTALPYGPGDPVQSLKRFDKDYGAMRVTVDSTGIHAQFIDRNGVERDSFLISR